VLEAIRQANPNAPDIDFSLGMVAMKQGNLKGGGGYFPQGLRGQSEGFARLGGAGGSAGGARPYDQAIQVLQSELAKDPKRNDLQMALGNLAVRAGNFDLAIAQFQTVLNELDKNSKARGDVYFRLGVTLRKGET
jgi:tetratricopeptide (TPR) repeat protein